MSGGNYKPIMDKKDNAQNDDIFQDKGNDSNNVGLRELIEQVLGR